MLVEMDKYFDKMLNLFIKYQIRRMGFSRAWQEVSMLGIESELLSFKKQLWLIFTPLTQPT